MFIASSILSCPFDTVNSLAKLWTNTIVCNVEWVSEGISVRIRGLRVWIYRIYGKRHRYQDWCQFTTSCICCYISVLSHLSVCFCLQFSSTSSVVCCLHFIPSFLLFFCCSGPFIHLLLPLIFPSLHCFTSYLFQSCLI